MGNIFRKEIETFFGSLLGYIIISFFVILLGLWVWVLPQSNVLDSGYADLNTLFRIGPYVWIFLAPAITMGLLAEERKSGTLELLLTSPISLSSIILGKYLASIFITLVTFILTIPYSISLYFLASPKGAIDVGAIAGSYVGLFLLSATFLAIGLCISGITSHQVVAFLVATLVCFLWFQGFEAWSTLQTWHWASLWIARLGMLYHYESLSKGVLDIRDIGYFLSSSSLMIILATNLLRKR